VNNVETYANIPQIILNGAEWYSSIGTAPRKAPNIRWPARSITWAGRSADGHEMREIIYDIGGGITADAILKRCRPADLQAGAFNQHLDTPIDYES
jgi:NADH:ubiquinone oxidoreductase subunit F (NADH-binding)